MAGGIIRAAVAAHSPRMGIEEKAPDFVRPLIAGLREMGDAIRAAKPDVIVVHSTHWVCTFMWYVTTQAVHKGVCVGDEIPDFIPGSPYQYKGDPEFARAIIGEIEAAGYPARPNDSPHYNWDYGSWIPVKYMDPKAEIPVVLIGTTIMADLNECMGVGGAVRKAAEKTGRRAVVVASSSFTHKLVRGPALWPTEDRMELDRRFIGLLTEGKIAEAKRWYPDYTEWVVGEMGGRNIALMLGAMDEKAEAYKGQQFGPYGQSSGSGNANVAVAPVG